MGGKVHHFGERVHSRKVILLGKGMEMVSIEVVLGSNLDMVVVILKVLAHNDHKDVVWVIGYMMDKGHIKVLGRNGLVSMVEHHVEDKIHRHMVVVDYHKRGHHSH